MFSMDLCRSLNPFERAHVLSSLRLASVQGGSVSLSGKRRFLEQVHASIFGKHRHLGTKAMQRQGQVDESR